MESRVKQWSSIEEKIERKALNLAAITDLDDLVGIRIILLFVRDLDRVDKAIHDTFEVLSAEDTGERLSDTQFGYHSRHYIIRIPDAWKDVPVFRRLRALKAEVQVRTLAQHIWAAASHKLQYKQEDSIPLPVRRTIHRVSALLETVDLEFERVLVAREAYIETNAQDAGTDEPLNVDLLAAILSDVFPAENHGPNEDYDGLMMELSFFKFDTVGKLRKLLAKHLTAVMNKDREKVVEFAERDELHSVLVERTKQGVFYLHCGLARMALIQEFGKKQYDLDVERFWNERLGK